MAEEQTTLAGNVGAFENIFSDESVRAQMARILGGQTFLHAPSLSRLLHHLVEHTLQGNTDELKEYSLGVEVFDRGASFDPRTDTIVRVQARRLRSKLDEYYEAEGRDDPLVIELPRPKTSGFGPHERSVHGWHMQVSLICRSPVAAVRNGDTTPF